MAPLYPHLPQLHWCLCMPLWQRLEAVLWHASPDMFPPAFWVHWSGWQNQREGRKVPFLEVTVHHLVLHGACAMILQLFLRFHHIQTAKARAWLFLPFCLMYFSKNVKNLKWNSWRWIPPVPSPVFLTQQNTWRIPPLSLPSRTACQTWRNQEHSHSFLNDSQNVENKIRYITILFHIPKLITYRNNRYFIRFHQAPNRYTSAWFCVISLKRSILLAWRAETGDTNLTVCTAEKTSPNFSSLVGLNYCSRLIIRPWKSSWSNKVAGFFGMIHGAKFGLTTKSGQEFGLWTSCSQPGVQVNESFYTPLAPSLQNAHDQTEAKIRVYWCILYILSQDISNKYTHMIWNIWRYSYIK